MRGVDPQHLDTEAVALCMAGDTAAFEPLVTRYEQRVFGFLYAQTSDVELSRDLTQDTFIRAWRKLSRFDPERPFLNWLLAIARNLLRDSRRRHREILLPIGGGEGEFSPVDPGPAADAGIESEDRRRLLAAALAWLSAGEREVVILKDIQDRSYAEIADILGVPRGTVASRVHHARRALAAQLEKLCLRYDLGPREILSRTEFASPPAPAGRAAFPSIAVGR